MSTPKTLATSGQSCAASHAAVTRRRAYTQVLFPYDRRTMPSISHNRKPAELPSPATALPHIRARDDPGSAGIEVRAILDGERLLIETGHGEEFAELSMEVFDGLLHATREMAKEAGPEPSR